MASHKIIIEKLRGIEKLVFNFPTTGVHVISAANGSGKTTLLVCIERIFNTRAFNENFKQHRASNVDSYGDAKISYYHKNGEEVTYTYRSHSDSWRPLTKSRNVLEDSYSKIQFMPTLGQRVYIQSTARSRTPLRLADLRLREAMAEVLEDTRFLSLYRANIGETRGRIGANRRENTAFRLPLGRKQIKGIRQNYYYSEVSFSLGEIFVLNLLYRIQNIEEGSLLLVDELEVALHPRVQYKLLRYLEKISIERNLTILVSTHSSSLIKCAKKLIFLEKENDGNVKVIHDCYPTYALRDIAILEDISPDYVFYVEDIMAEILLRLFVERYFQEEPTTVKPLWKVMPIGGYAQVLSFAKRSRDYLIPNFIGQYLFLDQDVVESKDKLRLLGNGRSKSEQKLWELFIELAPRTKYFDITPELGLWNWIINKTADIQFYIDNRYTDRTIDVERIVTDCNTAFPTPSANLRNDAKNKVNWLSNELGRQLGIDSDKTNLLLFGIYCDSLFSAPTEIGKLKALFGPIFNQRGNP